MGAAATAFMGAARSLYAGVSVEQAPTVQAAVKEILSGGRKPIAAPAMIFAIDEAPVRISAVDIGNGDDIDVGPDETAIAQVETVEDINVTNTGNLTGGIGIEVSTGAVNPADALFIQSVTTEIRPSYYEYVFDDAGNPVQGPNGQLSVATVEQTITSVVLAPDPLESTISIDNSGSISFSGSRGISAYNPAGQSITITSSGDISATQEVAGRVGIYAVTEYMFNDLRDNTLTEAGEFTRNANGQLVEVVSPDKFENYFLRNDMADDGGVINIHNTGDIDMGAVSGPWPYGTQSVGIYARGDGGTTIVNDGHITVDRWSSAIQVATTGALTITNNGRIDIGNGSFGITTGQSFGYAGDYRLGGDVHVLNTGDIFGGITKEEAGPDNNALFAFGMNIFALGSNNEYLASAAEVNQTYAAYNELLGYEAFPLIDAPNLRLYTTTVVNQGHIELKDGAVGLQITPRAGDSYAINSGTIIVGDGTSIAQNNAQIPSIGVSQSNFAFDGMGKTVSINTETGIIVTGDDSSGIQNHNFAGISITINEGSITTGNGVSTLITDFTGTTFDRLFQTFGMASVAPAPMFGTYAYALNTGEITVGDLAIGSATSGQGFSLIDQTRPTSINVNEGIISTGDNSTGMIAWGTVATASNTGTISTGSFDISAFQPHPEYTADEFAQLKFGMATYGANLSEAFNGGSVTTGDDTIGVAARMNFSGYGYGARVMQGEEGVITSGDRSIGVQVIGTYYAGFANEGKVSVGDGSVGADITAGTVQLRYGQTTATIIEGALLGTNDGIIETGDNSVGVRMNGVQEDVAYSGRWLMPDPDAPYGYSYKDYAGTADVTSAMYLTNSGTIRVGANSTAVEITGTAVNEQGLHFFNTGTVDASLGGSTALRINADHNIDSYAVNVGTMAGDITFGAGDDHFINTLMIDNAGRVTHSGNIVMNGSTIDFGAGTNSFDNDQGTITVLGGENLITGADVVMTQGIIEARNNAADSSLTIDGNVSGSFQFGADFNASGDADQLVITGDVAEGSEMRVILNPTGQMSGESTFKVIMIGGENAADDPVLAGITGVFADSVISAEVNYEDGEVNVTATFGMGHMATSATAATSMAQQWWMQSIGSLNKRDMQRVAEQEDDGLSTWASVFHEEGSVDPTNDLQDVSFDQKVSGLQAGVEWKGDIGGGSFNIGPMVSYGNASANQNANLASAMGDATAYGLNAGYRFSNGLYFNASWQQMAMEIDFRTPGTFSNATGNTDAEGDGFDLELGYAHGLSSGLTLAPQLQYSSVDVEVDDFTSSDGVYELSGMGGKHSLLRAGLSVFKTFQTTNGSITPLLDLSYLDAMDGDSDLSSNGMAFGNDTTGSGYRAEFGIAGRYKGWDIAGRVGFADTTAVKSALSSNLTVRYRW